MITLIIFALILALSITCLLLSAILFIEAVGVFIHRAAKGIEIYQNKTKEKNLWRAKLLRGGD